MKKLIYIVALIILSFSGILSSCTEEEVKADIPVETKTNPKEWE